MKYLCTSHQCAPYWSNTEKLVQPGIVLWWVLWHKLKSSGCSTAQSLLPECFARFWFSPVGSNHMYWTCMSHNFRLLWWSQVHSTMTMPLFVTVMLLHFFPVGLWTMTFQLSWLIAAFAKIPDWSSHLKIPGSIIGVQELIPFPWLTPFTNFGTLHNIHTPSLHCKLRHIQNFWLSFTRSLHLHVWVGNGQY